MADDEAAGKPSASRPGEKKSKAAKRPGEGPAPGASSSSMPPADARGLPPSGAARREAMGDDDVRSSTGSSQQPGRPKERVVRDTISIRSISPNPDGRLATSSSAAAIPASRPAPAPAALDLLEALEADGLARLERQGGAITGVAMTPAGRSFVRNACAAFDAHLPASTARHSASV
jgi:hypothetical protein